MFAAHSRQDSALSFHSYPDRSKPSWTFPNAWTMSMGCLFYKTIAFPVVKFHKSEMLIAQLCDPWTVAHQAPLSMEFSRQEYWSGLPFSSPAEILS